MLEATQHKRATFSTLTYDNEHLPILPNGRPTLVPADTRAFLNRLRGRLEPDRLRFFLCGEYGGRKQRPHYHAIIFGLECERESTLRDHHDRPIPKRCCQVCHLVSDTWGMGDVDLGRLTSERAAYTAHYVTKRLTRQDDERLDGRYPEFSRKSSMPGLGRAAAEKLADKIGPSLPPLVDVPDALGRNGAFPLGRYLKRVMRERLGRDPLSPSYKMEENENDVLYVRAHIENDDPRAKGDLKNILIQNALADLDAQRENAAENRRQIFTPLPTRSFHDGRKGEVQSVVRKVTLDEHGGLVSDRTD